MTSKKHKMNEMFNYRNKKLSKKRTYSRDTRLKTITLMKKIRSYMDTCVRFEVIEASNQAIYSPLKILQRKVCMYSYIYIYTRKDRFNQINYIDTYNYDEPTILSLVAKF